ncbi:uncharacterized protein LOC128958303 [Oppia nitens]|uniref:uncharacterized protein LOC128958303 n=1 Tax=Oppia nitens TaxID=1686743 RepID=UPI0023DAA977|nr:uncharacterized protein LOC128958303 [Oppia nitens]
MTNKSSSDEDLIDSKVTNDMNKDRAKRIVGLTNDPKSCPICLTQVFNRSLADTCLHEFCYECLHEWSADHNRCPVCRQSYRNIIHNVVSANKYDSEPVPKTVDEVEDEIAEIRQIYHWVRSVRYHSIQQRVRAINDLNTINNEINDMADSERQTNQRFNKLRAESTLLLQTIEELDRDSICFIEILLTNDLQEDQLLQWLNGRENNLPFNDEFEEIVDYNESDESVNNDLHEEDNDDIEGLRQGLRQMLDTLTAELDFVRRKNRLYRRINYSYNQSVQQRDRAINELNATKNEINCMTDRKTHQSNDRLNKLRELSTDLHKTIDELNRDLNSFSKIDYTIHTQNDQLLAQWLNSRERDIPINIDSIDIQYLLIQTIGSHESTPSSLETVESDSREDDNDCVNESGGECEDHGCHESNRKRRQTNDSGDEEDNSFIGQSESKRVRRI